MDCKELIRCFEKIVASSRKGCAIFLERQTKWLPYSNF